MVPGERSGLDFEVIRKVFVKRFGGVLGRLGSGIRVLLMGCLQLVDCVHKLVHGLKKVLIILEVSKLPPHR